MAADGVLTPLPLSPVPSGPVDSDGGGQCSNPSPSPSPVPSGPVDSDGGGRRAAEHLHADGRHARRPDAGLVAARARDGAGRLARAPRAGRAALAGQLLLPAGRLLSRP